MGHVWSRRSVVAALGTSAFIRPSWAANGLLEKLRKQGSMKVGIADNMPWSTLSPDGTMNGIAPALVNAVAPRMGIPKVEGIIATYGELVPGLLAGRWDMIGAALRVSPERCAQVVFTDPFYRTVDLFGVAYIKADVPNPPKSYKDAADRFDAIGLTAGTSEIPLWQTAMAAGKKGTITPFPDPDLMVRGLLAKRVQIVSADIVTLRALAKLHGGFEVMPIDAGHADRGSSGAFRKDDTDLRDAFLTEYRALRKSGTVAAILKKYDFEYEPQAMEITGEQACAI